ncbi:thiol-disulfide oxidoreductase DCC family protein [Gayadomonas joobiniege]|uniref:thiol-disulfide oxidoreductase DCC family protein n=1 Tax=Gayadomonas joobiniege TaxID=1234606 RepID=UPI000362BB9A|nr:DUF393 domain-containing protein [Gayadomonas joobiniege]
MDNRQVIIFDGVCNLCNGAINFIIKRDHANKFVFAPLQSQSAKALMAQYNVQDKATDTFILIKNNQCYVKTNAALEVINLLD